MNAGLVNDLLARIGITGPEWLTSTTWSMTAVVIMNCWVGIPFNMLLLLSGLSNINHDIYESAMIDGATPRHRFFYMRRAFRSACGSIPTSVRCPICSRKARTQASW